MPTRGQVVTKRRLDAGVLQRAVSDVMDGTLPVSHSSRAHGVSNEALRAALAAAGYVPPRRRPVPTTARRRTFGNGRRRGA